ncbi:septum formation initiator family protein [Candidatus Palauibacter polyketidifaciens]|uniref:FtsB family cell division protein n=1 Tax=Candidatus Palauibacter polyketidifaciens TaxID=3056740 RepID=UPI00238C4BBB|nr:septum formation initiator family protein [Candidatus Palauibacter polyketidifaciens]MDE2721091.1 septum formation initiator family protein [Candidatus Palauibacter polyketidifaciens]
MAEAANRRLTRAITFIALIGAGYYWMVGGEYTRADLVRLEGEIESREAEMTARNDELASIRAWADSLVSNAWAIERVARERYGFVRPQEILVRFVDLGDREPPGSATPPHVNVP